MAWFRKSYTVQRTYRDKTTEDVTIIADVQPSNDTSISPVGTTDRAIRIYTNDEIFPSNQPPSQAVKKDIITYQGEEYKVTKVEKYDGGIISHFEGTAVHYDLQSIVVYKPIRKPDGQGGYKSTLETLGALKAKINQPSMSMTGGETGSKESMVQQIIIDDELEGLDTSCQVEYKGEMLEILYIDRSKYDVLTLSMQKQVNRG